MTTLSLYDRPLEGTAFRGSLSGMFDSWRRTKRATGGYYEGKFIIRSGGMSELTDYYNKWIGCKVVETTFGIVSWEGIVWQLDLIKNGINYRRTLNPNFWQNKVKAQYTSTTQGLKVITSVFEHVKSSEIFGEMEMNYTLGASTEIQAANLAYTIAKTYSWPDSNLVGGLTASRGGQSSMSDGLYVTVLGLWTTLNWQIRNQPETDEASTLLATLVGETEFVTAGRLETNTLEVTADCNPIEQRIGDLIKVIIDQGDSSNNIWKGGVYADAKFVYEPAPTTIDYRLINGVLYHISDVPVSPSLINPGFYVRDSNAPTTIVYPAFVSGDSPNLWNEPGVSYCDEVEYIWPDELVLRFPGESVSVDVIQERIKRTPQTAPYDYPQPDEGWEGEGGPEIPKRGRKRGRSRK